MNTLTSRARLASTSALTLLALSLSAGAAAQESAPAEAVPANAAEIVVTGSRIARTGFTTPTRVTVVSATDLAEASPSTLSDALRTMPALTNTSGTQRNSGSTGGGQSFLNLRGLTAARTLTLINGRRFVSTNVTGTTSSPGPGATRSARPMPRR